MVAAIGLTIAGAALYSQIKLNVEKPPQLPQAVNYQSPSLNQTPSLSPIAPPKSILDKVTGVLSIQEVNNNKDAYIGKHINVRGQVYVQHHYSLMPCSADDPKCNPEIGDPTLHLTTPNNSSSSLAANDMIALYRKDSGGKFVPVTCKNINQNTIDCQGFGENSVVVVEGVFTKDKIPYQQVGDSAGNIKTLKYQDIYFLVIE